MGNYHPIWYKYSADENGNAYGARGALLSPILHHTGYHVITVGANGTRKQVRLHRFVWECLNGEIPEGMVINHINGIKTDNRLCNLEVVTNQYNIQHGWDVLGRESVLKGENSPSAKLTEEQVVELINKIKQGATNKELGEFYNIHPNYVSLIRHNRRWKHLPR